MGSVEAVARALLPAVRGASWLQRPFSSGGEGEEQREITDPTVLALADQIVQLNLLQVSDLTEILKKKLGITAQPMMGMPMGGFPGAAAPAADAAPAAAPAPVEEKTEWSLKLDGFDAAAKIKVIKEIRAITGLGLKEAKELVRTAACRCLLLCCLLTCLAACSLLPLLPACRNDLLLIYAARVAAWLGAARVHAAAQQHASSGALLPAIQVLPRCLNSAGPHAPTALQVEGAPKVVKEGLKKEEAEALQKTLVDGACGCSMGCAGLCRRACLGGGR